MTRLAPYLKLLPTPSRCAPNATFVTLIANETYVPGAVCLRRSMARVGSRCPLSLVVADPLPDSAMAELTAAFAGSRIRRLSDLRARVDQHKRAGRRLQTRAQLMSTRQLVRATGWAHRTFQKLLLFALDGYSRAAFLDIDMLIARNVDALLDQPPFAAVAALPYAMKQFNSGVFVFTPSLADATALEDLSLRASFDGRLPVGSAGLGLTPIRIQGAGERDQLTDQSIFNHHFKGRWTPLPYGYNMGVKTRKANRKLWTRTEVAIVHFVHRPKPWEAALAQPTAELWKLAERYNIEPLVRLALSAIDCDGLRLLWKLAEL